MNVPVMMHPQFHHSTLFYHIIFDRKGQCISSNQLFLQSFYSCSQFYTDISSASAWNNIQELQPSSENTAVAEIYHEQMKGGPRYIQWEFSALDKEHLQAIGKDVTSEKLALQQFRKSATEFELFLANSDETFIMVDKGFAIIEYNETAARFIREMMGKELRRGISLWDIITERERSLHERFYNAAFKGIFSKDEIGIITSEGKKAWFDAYFQPARNEANEIVAVIVTARDITARKNAEQQLKLNEERWKFALEGSNQGVWDWNIETGETFYSPRWKKLLGLSDEDITNTIEDWSGRIHPDDRSLVDIDIETHFNADDPHYENIYRLQCKDGSYKWILARGVIIERNATGKPLRMIGTHTDITALKKTEIALKTSEENYRQLFFYNPQPMWIYDIDTLYFLEVNNAAIRHYGYTLEEFKAMTIRDIRPREDLTDLNDRLSYIGSLPNPGFQESFWRHLKKNGSMIEVEIKSHNVEYNGRAARLVLVNDISEQREAAYRLAHERQLLRTLIDNLPDYIYIKDRTLHTLISNQATRQLISNEAGKATLILSDSHLESDRRVIETGNPVYNLEEPGIFNNGEQQWLLTTKVPLKNTLNEVIGLVGISRDITERKKMQTALSEQHLNMQRSITEATIEAQEQERADIGKELHDNINQILTTTKLYIDMAINDEEVRMELMEKSYRNISKAIEEIRDLSRALVPPSLQDIGLEEAINEMIVNLPLATGLKVKLKTSGLDDDELPDSVKLMAYRIVQEQVNNIVKHARAANAEIRLMISKKMLNIIISDDGIGFDTKKKRRGIGLSNISSRAALHKGQIEIISAPGSGCTLKVFIPL